MLNHSAIILLLLSSPSAETRNPTRIGNMVLQGTVQRLVGSQARTRRKVRMFQFLVQSRILATGHAILSSSPLPFYCTIEL